MFISKFDLITPPIGLHFRGKGSHSSIVSGIITLLAYIIIVYFAFRYSLEYVKKKKPTAYYVNRHVEDAGIYIFNSTSFFHYIFLTNKRSREIIEFDFDSFRIIGFTNKLYATFMNTNAKYELFPHWIYGKCDINTDGKDNEDIIKIGEFSKAACIKKYYDPQSKAYYDVNDQNFVAPEISHGMSNDNYSFYSFIVERCKDDNLRKLSGLGACKSNETIDTLIRNSIINLRILDNYPDILNYNNPFKKYFYSTNGLLYTNSFISHDISFNPALLKTNYGIVFDSSRIKYTYMFDEMLNVNNDEEYDILDSNGTKVYDENGKEMTRHTGFVAAFQFYIQNRLQHYERTYQKLQDLLSKIGGFGKTTFLIASTINIIFFKFITLLDTEDFVLSLHRNLNNMNEETMCNVIQKDPKENNHIIYKIHNPNLYENNLKKKNLNQNLEGYEISKIKQIDKDNKKSIINIKDGTSINKSEINSVINNSEESSNQPDGFLNIPNKKCNFHWLQYIWYMITCGISNQNITYYENFRQRILSEENVIVSHYNLYKLISLLRLDNCDELILDKKYITRF